MSAQADRSNPSSAQNSCPVVRIAMWSGPRNISTALMRSWENRPDTIVCDEPLYAHYLLHSGREHPISDAIINHYENDWRKVVAWLSGPLPDGKRVFYQKHMTHHFLPRIEHDWLAGVTNCFLIREPREMLTSLMRILPEPVLTDTGLPQQVDIFNWVREHTGTAPIVLDAKDVLEAPRRMLVLLCEALGVPFSEAMLEWPPGPRDTDGIWAEHWYGSVLESTTFQPYKPKPDVVPPELEGLLEQCNAYYEVLYPHRLGQ